MSHVTWEWSRLSLFVVPYRVARSFVRMSCPGAACLSTGECARGVFHNTRLDHPAHENFSFKKKRGTTTTTAALKTEEVFTACS